MTNRRPHDDSPRLSPLSDTDISDFSDSVPSLVQDDPLPFDYSRRLPSHPTAQNIADGCDARFCFRSPVGPEFGLLEYDWSATIFVKTDNIALLMRDGFHWSEANIWPETASIDYNHISASPHVPFAFNRRCYLSDASDDQRWTAWLFITLKMGQEADLAKFPISELVQDKMYAAKARNEHREVVYQYFSHLPARSFNMIFPGRNLSGWPAHISASSDTTSNDEGQDTDE